jgi:hypothetical protein
MDVWALVKPDPVTGCLIWQGSMKRGNLPEGFYHGERQSMRRVFYYLASGEFIEGFWHVGRCGEPRCVSPDHAKKPVTEEEYKAYAARALAGEKLRDLAIEAGIARETMCIKTLPYRKGKV